MSNDGKTTSAGTKLVCGSIAGVIGTICIYPFDITKTLRQNSNSSLSGYATFRQIVHRSGILGLYQGLSANLIGIIPEKAIKLAVNDIVRERCASYLNVPVSALPLPYGMLAGASAGLCQVVATNPMEIVKIKIQIAKSHASATPPSVWSVVQELGPRGLFRGTPATLLRDVPFSVLFFPLFAMGKHACEDKEGNVGFTYVLGSGLVAGAFAGAAVTPMDVVKTRLQAGTNFQTIAGTAKHIYKHEGAAAFFRGTFQRCMIVSPLFGITLLVYEIQQRYFSHL